MKSEFWACKLVLAGCMTACGFSANAQSVANSVTVEPVTGPTVITDGDFYTQVLVKIGDLTPPNDDRGQKEFGRALLNSLRLDNKTRSISVTLKFSVNGQSLPEVPIITYDFDSSRRMTDFKTTNGHLTPRWNIPAGTPIQATLKYRYVQDTKYDPNFLTGSVSKLIPSSTVVQSLSQPFITEISNLTSAVFSAANSRSVSIDRTDPLEPSIAGSVGARQLRYTLTAPGKGGFGEIDVALLASPSLQREGESVLLVEQSSLRQKDSDDVGRLTLDIKGESVNLLDYIKALPSYIEMENGVTLGSVQSFCQASRSTSDKFGLTRMDRNNLTLQAMRDAGFLPGEYREDANDWLSSCFGANVDRTYLQTFRFVDFAPPPSPL